MNLLFYTTYRVSATKGGVERATISVAKGLKEHYGCRCFSAYHRAAGTPMEDCFEAEFHWPNLRKAQGLKAFCQAHQIDGIINQGEFSIARPLRQIADALGCKLYFAHHFEPGWETNFLTLHGLMNELKGPSKTKTMIKIVLFPILRLRHLYTLPKRYREAYRTSDQVVLLCQGFIPQYQQYGGFRDEQKFVVIPNALSFDTVYEAEAIAQKKKVALVVSRLEEKQKRLSLALRVWQAAKQQAASEGWTLQLVGHGEDEQRYRQMVEEDRIPDVCFLGRQKPEPFYREASVFLMTSRSEGFGLTLIESQQFGVVPMAFQTYAAVTDIIRDGENGFVIPEGDVAMYVEKLLQLMSDQERRQCMAVQEIESSKRFSPERIAEKWWRMLNG